MNNAITDLAHATIREIRRRQPMWDSAETDRLRVLAWKAMVHAPLMLWLRATALRIRMEYHLRRLRNSAPQL
jgi:hypothetical protein